MPFHRVRVGTLDVIAREDRQVNIVVLTPVRLLGESLAACFGQRKGLVVVAVLSDLASLRATLALEHVDLALIDVTHGLELYDIGPIAVEHTSVALVALGVDEGRQDVVRCGRAGFSGYVSRDASVDALCQALHDVVGGRLSCPAEISSSLLRALFRQDAPGDASSSSALTRRETDVLQLIGHGMSNKEIARELYLSVATVKHHVHNVLDKLNLPRRAQAMRRVREAPWLVARADEPPLHRYAQK